MTYDEKNSIVPQKGNMVLVIGKGLAVTYSVSEEGETWYFDTDKGREEVLNRALEKMNSALFRPCSQSWMPSVNMPEGS